MRNFIEITNTLGQKEFINTRHIARIVEVERAEHLGGGYKHTLIELANDSFTHTFERYEQIVEKIYPKSKGAEK